MKKTIYTVYLLLFCSLTMGEEYVKSVNTEAIDTINFLQAIPEYDRPFVKVFTTYDLPTIELRQKAAAALSFVCHSLCGPSDNEFENTANYSPIAKFSESGEFLPVQAVPNSDTLFFIDIRDYNWTNESFEKISVLSPYEVVPAIQRSYYKQLRLISGNSLLRASWFISHATDVMRQTDIDEATKIYYELLYSKVGEPKTGQDFKRIWGLDEKRINKYGVSFAALVITQSQVARHNRILRNFPTAIGGYLYETIDVKNEEDFRDYLETLPENKGFMPNVKDAGELIATNQLNLQVYALVDNKDNIIDFADGAVARHPNDVISDSRVRVSIGCNQCHGNGIILVNNVASQYKDFLNIKTAKHEYKARIERVFQNGSFNEQVKRDNELFAEAVKKVNGLTTEKNTQYLLDIIRWYSKPLDLEQVCRELGATEEILREKISKSHEIFLADRVPGRLKLVLHDLPVPISRFAWESNSKERPGTYQESSAILHGLTLKSEEYIKNPLPKTDPRVTLDIEIEEELESVKATKRIEAKSGSNVVHVYQIGEEIVLSGEEIDNDGTVWSEAILPNNTKAYIQKEEVE